MHSQEQDLGASSALHARVRSALLMIVSLAESSLGQTVHLKVKIHSSTSNKLQQATSM